MNNIFLQFSPISRQLPLTFLVLTALGSTAQAALIERDWQVAGDAALTYDTATGLEWLDLTETSGLSFNEVVPQLGISGTLEDFSYASDTQVKQLFNAISLPELALGQSMYGTQISELLSYWGVLWEFTPTSGRSEFIISNIENLPIGQHWTGRVVWSDSGDTGAAAKFLTVEDDYKNFIIGSALVRHASIVQLDGDVNRDGVTNLGDLYVILQVVLGNSAAPSIEPGHADFYPPGAPDGIIGMPDLILMRKIID
jgi:hypothetical protein